MGVSPVSGVTRAFAVNYPQETAEIPAKNGNGLGIPAATDDIVTFNTPSAAATSNKTGLQMRGRFGSLSLSGREISETQTVVSEPKKNYIFIKPS